MSTGNWSDGYFTWEKQHMPRTVVQGSYMSPVRDARQRLDAKRPPAVPKGAVEAVEVLVRALLEQAVQTDEPTANQVRAFATRYTKLVGEVAELQERLGGVEALLDVIKVRFGEFGNMRHASGLGTPPAQDET